MAIVRPTTKTLISTTNWGIPITDAVNANTTAIANNVPTAWTNPTFLNGWMSYGSGYAPGQYRKVGDMVQIRGLVKSGSLGNAIFMLPVGYRPTTGNLQFAVENSGGHGQLEVRTGGDVIIANLAANPSNAACNINCSFSTTS
jgi:hypothetical protein